MLNVGFPGRNLERQSPDFVIEALSDALPPQWVTQALEQSGCSSIRKRLLPAPFMVWFVILMGLFRHTSYANLLEKLHDGWWTTQQWPPDKLPTTTAVTKARDRLGVEPMKLLFERVAAAEPTPSARRLFIIDGTCLKTPDTQKNREHFGAPKARRGASASPQLRLCALLDVTDRRFRAVRHGGYHDGEITLARGLLDDIPSGSLTLMDRNFLAYDFLWDLYQEGKRDFIVRVKKNITPVMLRRLGEGDALVEAELPGEYHKKRPDMPQRWVLRMISYLPAGGDETIRLFTTQLDPAQLSKEEAAELYHTRWDEETAFDELKTHLCEIASVNDPTAFRSKTPERVIQEMYGVLIAYNLIRRNMGESARGHACSPLRLSFTAAVERIREAVYDMTRLPTPQLPLRYQKMLNAISRARVPPRPGRHNPRAIKVKMSKHRVKRRQIAA